MGDKSEVNLELINYQIQELRGIIIRNHAELEKRLDKKDAERAVLTTRVNHLETWRTEEVTKQQEAARLTSDRHRLDERRHRWTLSIGAGVIMLFLKDAYLLVLARLGA